MKVSSSVSMSCCKVVMTLQVITTDVSNNNTLCCCFEVDEIRYTAPSNAVFSSEQKSAGFNPLMPIQKSNAQSSSLTQSNQIW
uniref:Uncharacterized protein n=1 Tax=Romanomermis culicivorax TaxID=13658 RepID=A0A915IPQ1_ROMCU